jgi:hypothetical protein
MKSPARWKLSILLFAITLVALPPALAAFTYPLSSEAIREAYFLGKRNDEQTAAFLVKYVHALQPPKNGSYVASIGIETPYSAIVQRSQGSPMGYHATDAEHEFLGNARSFRVRLKVYFMPPHAGPLGDFWRDFTIHLEQGAEIQPRTVEGHPYRTRTTRGYVGAEIVADYDVNKIDSGGPVNVDVIMPDGQNVKTTFDLSELR